MIVNVFLMMLFLVLLGIAVFNIGRSIERHKQALGKSIGVPISMGVSAKPLTEQLKEAGCEHVGEPSIERLQNATDAVSFLFVTGFITKGEARKISSRVAHKLNPRPTDSRMEA